MISSFFYQQHKCKAWFCLHFSRIHILITCFILFVPQNTFVCTSYKNFFLVWRKTFQKTLGSFLIMFIFTSTLWNPIVVPPLQVFAITLPSSKLSLAKFTSAIGKLADKSSLGSLPSFSWETLGASSYIL